MALKFADLTAPAYGTLMAGMERWDRKRIREAKLKEEEILKKAGFYATLVPGLAGLGMYALDRPRRMVPYAEPVAKGFMTVFPGFIWDIVETLTKPGSSAAVREASRIVAGSRRALSPGTTVVGITPTEEKVLITQT